MTESDLVEQISALVQSGHYPIRFHAVQHMIEEGFDENHLLEALKGKLKIMGECPEEARCLALGYYTNRPSESRNSRSSET